MDGEKKPVYLASHIRSLREGRIPKHSTKFVQYTVLLMLGGRRVEKGKRIRREGGLAIKRGGSIKD